MDGINRRREQRRQLCHQGPAVDGRLIRDRIRLSGRLWDLSAKGCCFSSHGADATPATGEPATLELSDPAGGDDLELCVRVIWVQREATTRFIGMAFLAPIAFGSTFLAPLLNGSERVVHRS